MPSYTRERIALINKPAVAAVAVVTDDPVHGPILFLKIPFAPAAVDVWEVDEEAKRGVRGGRVELRDELSNKERRERD